MVNWSSQLTTAVAFVIGIAVWVPRAVAQQIEAAGFKEVGFKNKYYQVSSYVGSRVLEFNQTARFTKYLEVTWTQTTTVDKNGNIWIADKNFHQIIFVEATTRYVPYAAYYLEYAGMRGTAGHLDSGRTEAKFDSPSGIAVAQISSRGKPVIYVSDTNNHVIRRLDFSTGRTATVVGSAKRPGLVDGLGLETRFSFPLGLGVDDEGANLFVLDNGKHIRHVSLFNTPPSVSTLIGGACRAVNQWIVHTSIYFRTVGCHPDWLARDAGENSVKEAPKSVICIGHVSTCSPRHHPAIADRLSPWLEPPPPELMDAVMLGGATYS